LRRIALEPVVDDVVIELMRPEQAGIRLPNDAPLVISERSVARCKVEFICLGAPLFERLLERRSKSLECRFVRRRGR